MKLRVVSKVQGGYAFKSQEFQSEGVPIIRIGNLDGKNVDLDYEVCYPNRFWDEHPEFRVRKNNILIAMSGATVGKIGLYESEEKALLNQRVCILKPDESMVTNDYLYFYCLSPTFKNSIKENAFGCAQPNISASQISDFEINVPTKDTQRRYVEQLQKIKSIIDKKEKELVELDNLIKSRFVEMFGDLMINPFEWPIMKIAEVSTFLKSGLSRKLSDDDIGLPVIRSGNIQNGRFEYDDIKYWHVDDPQGANTSDYILDDGDILVNFINSASQIGKTTIFRSVGRDCIYTTNIFRMKLANNCNEYYYNWFAMTDYYYRQLQNIIQPAVNQASFTTGSFLKLNIPLPPLEKQKEFAAFVEQVDKLKFEVQKSLEETQQLMDSLMQKYFG